MNEQFLTASEVAELLKLNPETVYNLIAKEDLPATKVGGQWRFLESEIHEWFESRRVQQEVQLKGAVDGKF